MMNRVRGVAVALLFFLPLTASAHGWRSGRIGGSAYYYYPPAVSYFSTYSVIPYMPSSPVPYMPSSVPVQTPAPSCPPLAVEPVPFASPYAQPIPAPPSEGPVIPATPPAPEKKSLPAVTESPPAQEVKPAPPRLAKYYQPTGDRAAVSFWNLSPRDVILQVEGQTLVLARGKTLKFDLSRQFVWREGDQEAQTEQIPKGSAGVEIVIRR